MYDKASAVSGLIFQVFTWDSRLSHGDARLYIPSSNGAACKKKHGHPSFQWRIGDPASLQSGRHYAGVCS